MPPNFESTYSALRDRNEKPSSSLANADSQGEDSSPDAPQVSRLCSAFSQQCSISSPVGRDPFGTLPWFGLEEVLLNLPDLPTLHQLVQASPAVADYLDHKVGVFPKVVDIIMDRRENELYSRDDNSLCTQEEAMRGLNEDTRVFFRTLVYLWWKEESVATGVPSDENPLPEDFNDLLVYTINITTEGFYSPPKVGLIDLPRSTPPRILRYLLSLASRIRRDAHAFFHDTMKLCMSTKIYELKYKKAHWAEDGRRPRGILFNKHGYNYYLNWMEEQRLMLAFLKPYIFSVLRRVVCEKRLLKPISSLPDPLPHTMYPDTLKNLEQNSLADFWSPFGNYGWMRTEPMEQMETVLTWLEEGKASHGIRRKRETKFTTCCPEYSSLTDKQLKRDLGNLQHITLPGPFWAQSCTVVPHSGVNAAGFRGEFRRFGVSFWDMNRMECLGLATPRMHRELDQIDLAFRWSSLLLSKPKWGPRKKHQPKRGLQFRSQTKAIELGK
ncbi:hypothetical protein PITC_030480 [Penicillium italicum]|uniref:Uncharacterized protein n=1 Tax=Penicillium italicum TaxID=40296 RepID=A0A0A2L960_PENIT|nr:hypothetical protein PITC_030480 [Penicillium italicum]